MRDAYYGGATGALTSATAWLASALVAAFVSPIAGLLTLIFGGMAIFPLSVLLSKAIGRSGKHSSENPLGRLAIEGTFWMILIIPVAVGVALFKIEWFFPAMLLVIAGRYLTFATLYGMRIYWAFGATLALAAFPLAILNAPVFIGALAGALIEYMYGVAIFLQVRGAATQ